MKKAILGLALTVTLGIYPFTINTRLLYNLQSEHKVAILSDEYKNSEGLEKYKEIIEDQNKQITDLFEQLVCSPKRTIFISDGGGDALTSKQQSSCFEYHSWIVPHLFFAQQSSNIGNLALKLVNPINYSEIDQFILLQFSIEECFPEWANDILEFAFPNQKIDNMLKESIYGSFTIEEYCKIITQRCESLIKSTSNMPSALKEKLKKEIERLAHTITAYINNRAHELGLSKFDNILYVTGYEVSIWSKYLEYHILNLYRREKDIQLLNYMFQSSPNDTVVQCMSGCTTVLERCLLQSGYCYVLINEDNQIDIQPLEDHSDKICFCRNDHHLSESDDLPFVFLDEFPMSDSLIFFNTPLG